MIDGKPPPSQAKVSGAPSNPAPKKASRVVRKVDSRKSKAKKPSRKPSATKLAKPPPVQSGKPVAKPPGVVPGIQPGAEPGIQSVLQPKSEVRAGSQTALRVKPISPARARPRARQVAKLRPTDRLIAAPPLDLQSVRVEECRQRIDATLQPARLIKLCEECERDVPAGPFLDEIRRIAAGARQALEIQRATGLSADLFEDPAGDLAFREHLGQALRGDKDAAYRLAVAYRAGDSGVAASSRRMEQWLRFAAELGNGLASWELAEYYNYGGLVADAAKFEKKALELGYRPPSRLPTRGY